MGLFLPHLRLFYQFEQDWPDTLDLGCIADWRMAVEDSYRLLVCLHCSNWDWVAHAQYCSMGPNTKEVRLLDDCLAFWLWVLRLSPAIWQCVV